MCLGAAIFLLFHFWDLLIDEANSRFGLIVRITYSTSVACVFAWSFAQSFERYMQAVLCVVTACGGLAIAWILSSLTHGLERGVAGAMLMLMFTFSFCRLLFIPSLISAMITAVGYTVFSIVGGQSKTQILINDFFLVTAIVVGTTSTYYYEKLYRWQYLTASALETERNKTDTLLASLLPSRIAKRLKDGETMIADSHGEASVLFCDLVGFSELTRRVSPGHLVELLNELFSILDNLADRHGVEKVKTIGDGYMVVSGVGERTQDATEKLADFALALVHEVELFAKKRDHPLRVRVGMSTGHAISGVIGTRRPFYDVWGDTVNVASRMEAAGESGRVQVSESTYWRLKDKYEFEKRGEISLKGIGQVQSWFLLKRREVAVAPS